MNVDMNNLRKQAIYSYARLCKTLNAHKGKMLNVSIIVDIDDIQADMDDLRQCLVALACCYNEGDDDFREVIDEVGEIAFLENEED